MKKISCFTVLTISFLVSLYVPVLAQVEVNPDELNFFVTGNESVTLQVELTNTGTEVVDFSVPFFNDTMARPFPVTGRTGITQTIQLSDASGISRRIFEEYRSGRVTNLTATQKQAVENLMARVEGNILGLMPNATILYEYQFEDLALDGQVFELVSEEPFSGTVGGFNGNFVLNSASSQVWANDLTMIITDGPDLMTATKLVQFGGLFSTGAQRVYRWNGGNSGAEGTIINETIPLIEEIELEDVYIWIGNGWLNGTGNWTGSISLLGEDLQPVFISDVTPASGTLEPGESITLDVSASGQGLEEGFYVGDLKINTTVENVSVLTYLLVTGIPEASFEPLELSFGDVFVGQSERRIVTIQNNGEGTLVVSEVSSSNSSFTTEFENFAIPSNFFVPYEITFSPTQDGFHDGIITFETNDPEAPIVEVSVTGNGVIPPGISLNPNSFEFTLDAGETSGGTFTISNIGEGTLEFELPNFSVAARGTSTPSGKSITIQEQIQEGITAVDKALVEEYKRTGSATDATIEALNRINEIQTKSNYQVLESNVLNNIQPALNIDLEDFTAFGFEFSLISESVTGSLTGIDADFILEFGGDFTWASDLTILFVQNNDDNENDEFHGTDILLQIGGTTSFSMNRISWGMGNSDVPGTEIKTFIELNQPFELDDVSIWIGNGWAASDVGIWNGSIGLFGVKDGGNFITDASPAIGTLNPGESTEINFTVDTIDLIGGTYNSRIRVLSNDPNNPISSVGVELRVLGTSDILIENAELNFPQTFTGGTSVLPLVIQNTGTDILEITTPLIDNSGFEVPTDGLSISPGRTGIIEVVFRPEVAGTFTGTLTIESNGVSGAQSISLFGEAVNPGLLAMDPESLSFSLAQGETETQFLSLTNTGESDLEFNIQFGSGSTMAARSTSSPERQAKAYLMQHEFLGVNKSGNHFNSKTKDTILLNSGSNDVIWDQAPSDFSGVVSMKYSEFESGVYTADRFTVEDGAIIHKASFYGFTLGNFNDIPNMYEGVGIAIFEDQEGKPIGNPDTVGDALFSAETTLDSSAIEILVDPSLSDANKISVDIFELLGSGIILQPGSYWITFYLIGNNPHDITWYLMGGNAQERQAHIIDPSDFFDYGLIEWENLSTFIDGGFAIAYRLEGTTASFLSSGTSSGVISPGQTIEIPVMVDATILNDGEYNATILVNTNSPQTPQGTIPVQVLVEPTQMAMSWVNLHKPNRISVMQGEEFHIHGLMKSNHLHNDDSFLDGVRMWVGFHTSNIHPAMWDESAWIEGSLYEIHEEMAEFMVETGSHLSPGTYYFATRFHSEGSTSMVYGGYHIEGGGFWQEGLHTSGELIIAQSTSVDDIEVPFSFNLFQNYPNPFNPTTQISFEIPETSDVRLEVFNIQGQRVATLVEGSRIAGRYTISFDASSLSSGVYIYRLQAGGLVSTRKMTMVK